MVFHLLERGDYMDAIILAAGLGNRIHSVNPRASKCLLLVHGESLLQRKLDAITECKEVERVFIVIHNKEEKIQKLIGKKYRDVPVYYIRQKKENGGLLNAVFNVLEEVELQEVKNVLICLGDEYFEKLNLQAIIADFQNATKEVYAICVPTEKEEKIRNNYSVRTDDKLEILEAVEKPKTVFNDLIGTGVIMMSAVYLLKFWKAFKKGKCRGNDLVDLFNQSKAFGYRTRAYVENTEYVNVNTVSDLNQITQNRKEYPRYDYVIDLFQETVEKYGERIAIVQDERSVTYKEIDRLSDVLCYNMQQKFEVRGKGIGILCGRTIEHIITVISVLKAGGYYIPIDEHLPEGRIQYMAKKSGCEAIIVLKQFCNMFQIDTQQYTYEELIKKKDVVEVPYSYAGMLDKSAYVIFTSGSTGVPKGVEITEKNLLNFVWGMKQEILDRHKSDYLKIGVLASFSFDLSVQQIFPSILFGHTIHIIPYEAKLDPKLLMAYLNQLDICDGTPMILNLLNHYMIQNQDEKLTLKHYISGGEELRKSIINQFFQLCPDICVTNGYGPTECTVETTFFHLDKEIEKKYESIPIGKTIGNLRVYVLDQDKKLLPQNEEGEIWIAGMGVAKGYIHDKELTEAAFQKDILCPGKKMYKTGDIGYFSEEGDLYYIGRSDSQIKLKGYRIEIGEIEKVLQQMDGVRECRVLVRNEVEKESLVQQCLVAYLIFSHEKKLELARIIDYLKNYLPEYMIPQYFVPVEQLTINNSGKLDKYALPDFREHAMKSEKITKIKEDILEDQVFKEVMSTIALRVGTFHDFNQSLIALGIDSIRMFEILSDISYAYNLKLDIREFRLWMSPFELYERICQYKDDKMVGKAEDEINLKKSLIKGIKVQGMPEYFYHLERRNRITQDFRLLHNMIYFVRIADEINYEKLNYAYKMVQKENDAFQYKFMQKGKYLRIIKGNWGLQELIVKEQCPVVSLIHGQISSYDINEDILKYFYDEIEEISFETILYKVFYCTYDDKKMLMLSIHHGIFDYFSLLNFMNRLTFYYKNYNKRELDVVNKNNLANYFLKINNTLSENTYQNEKKWMTEQAKKITYYDKNLFLKCMKQEKMHVDRIIVHSLPYTKDEKYKISGCQIPDGCYKAIKLFGKRYNLTESNILTAVFYYLLKKYAGIQNPAFLFYATGRNDIEQIHSIGFYSFLMFFEGSIEWNGNFVDFVMQIEKRQNELIKNSINPIFLEDAKVEKLMREEMIFDYQKLFNNKKNEMWSLLYPFESSGFVNPISFRIFDYGTFAEISILYNNEVVKQGNIDIFVQEFCDICLEFVH